MKLARLSFWLILATGAVHFMLTGARISSGRSEFSDMARLLVEMALCGAALMAMSRAGAGRVTRLLMLALCLALYIHAISGGLLWSNLGQLVIATLAVAAGADIIVTRSRFHAARTREEARTCAQN